MDDRAGQSRTPVTHNVAQVTQRALMQLRPIQLQVYPRRCTAFRCGVCRRIQRNFDETPGRKIRGRPGLAQGIDGDLTAMTCGRIGPDEMTDPASDIRYHGGRARPVKRRIRGTGRFKRVPSIELTLKFGLIAASYISSTVCGRRREPSSSRSIAVSLFFSLVTSRSTVLDFSLRYTRFRLLYLPLCRTH